MFFYSDKLMHFGVGLVVGAAFWKLLERFCPKAVQRFNPFLFIVFLVWGASGLFLLRRLHLPVLSGDLFYMAVPDWDIPFYNLTRLRFLIHRSWLFHSVLIPILILGVSVAGLLSSGNRLWKWSMDSAIALSVGMTAHLLWDALLSSTKRGFVIHSWGVPGSLVWLVINLLVGLAVSLAVIWGINQSVQE